MVLPPDSTSTGVISRSGPDLDAPLQPIALICREEDIRRLCGRYAQLHGDLSPLTAWCHLLTPRFFEPFKASDDLTQWPELGGFQAAWAGLVVAEALLLSEKPLASLRIPACLATQTFAIARTRALWRHIPLEEIVRRFESANRLCRNDSFQSKGEFRSGKVRSCLQPIWATLSALSEGVPPLLSELRPLVSSLHALQHARLAKDKNEARRLSGPLIEYVPEAEAFVGLADLTPEMRLRVFDQLVAGLNKAELDNVSVRRNGLALLAGYLSTVAAGNYPSLSLAESNANRFPEITAWAYVVGGVGERVFWTSSFDGLGRLVARELMRPMRLDESPLCDFAFDEAVVLVDWKLADPLVRLRIKQARIVTVALLPGVNISIPVGEGPSLETNKQEPVRSRLQQESSISVPAKHDALGVLADAVWPYLRVRVENFVEELEELGRGQSKGPKRKNKQQAQLPLNNQKK
jgi:hypothetical protein